MALKKIVVPKIGPVLRRPTGYNPAPDWTTVISLGTMGLGKQAKTLTKAQVDAALNYLSSSRYPLRNRAILLLSVKAGLRAKEIASLTWDMATTSDTIMSTASRSKGDSLIRDFVKKAEGFHDGEVVLVIVRC
jgi:integrase